VGWVARRCFAGRPVLRLAREGPFGVPPGGWEKRHPFFKGRGQPARVATPVGKRGVAGVFREACGGLLNGLRSRASRTCETVRLE
jgi:hypothetical protein